MKENEFVSCLKKYLGAKCTCDKGYLKQSNKIMDAMEKITYSDAPDGYSCLDDKIVIFEHFEFDSTRNNRKGSEQKREKYIIDKNFDDWSREHEGVFIQKSDTVASTTLLANNFIKALTSHSNKLESYKTNLIRQGIGNINTKFEFCIIAENTDWYGMSCIDKYTWKALSIYDIKECVDCLKRQNFDYLLIFSKINNEYAIEIKHKIEFTKMRLKNIKSANDISLFCPSPITIGGNRFIPYNKK